MKARNLPLLLLITAFLAAGSHLDIAQLFAWGRMFAINARTLPLNQAFRQTFDPERSCRLCRAVQHARDQQEQSPLPDTKLPKEILLACAPRSLFLANPAPAGRLLFQDWSLPGSEQPAPPVPPPRFAV